MSKGVIAMKVDWLFKNVTVIDGAAGRNTVLMWR